MNYQSAYLMFFGAEYGVEMFMYQCSSHNELNAEGEEK